MTKQTALHDRHVELGAKMVDFAGWRMPIAYSSQVDEHHAVRKSAGVFDVSHMRVIDIDGDGATRGLRRLLANDVTTLVDGKALYSCMLRDDGGVLDDLIVTRRNENAYRAVVNAATAEADFEWMSRQLGADAVTVQLRDALSILAVQGPEARRVAAQVLPGQLREAAASLKRFRAVEAEGWTVSRTGYTGEDGYEILLPDEQLAPTWNGLVTAGAVPCGLGARDTLRLEAGMNLYGQDMTENETPLDCGLDWTVAFEPEDREFIGRDALLAQRRERRHASFFGVVLEGRGVMRHGYPVHADDGRSGELTSGGYSPTLGCSIGLARLPPGETPEVAEVEIRGVRRPLRIAGPPFVRNGTSLI